MAQLSNRAYAAPLSFAFLTGWRLASEVLTLTWANVDLESGVVKLDPDTVTKNKQGRTLPTRALPEIHEMLVSQRAFVSEIERANDTICSLVFPRLNGAPIKSLRGAWDEAATRAGFEGALIHDLRRSSARRYTAAGVPRGVAMKLAGWKTEAIFNKYDRVSGDDLSEGLAKVAKLRAEKNGPRSGPKEEKTPAVRAVAIARK
ncbi:MAG: tyrosine-type recombinase/integrase [Gemmatimonadota bacterium]|nr:tyrosine-type recombinase/integrase [Gemmatimonadota bacterium]